jgi:hypothetical protein
MTTTCNATYSGDEMTVIFTAQGKYWPQDGEVDITDIDVESLEILGQDVAFSKLPIGLQASILELADELEFWPEGQE